MKARKLLILSGEMDVAERRVRALSGCRFQPGSAAKRFTARKPPRPNTRSHDLNRIIRDCAISRATPTRKRSILAGSTRVHTISTRRRLADQRDRRFGFEPQPRATRERLVRRVDQLGRAFDPDAHGVADLPCWTRQTGSRSPRLWFLCSTFLLMCTMVFKALSSDPAPGREVVQVGTGRAKSSTPSHRCPQWRERIGCRCACHR